MRYLSILILLSLPSLAVAEVGRAPRPVDPAAAEMLARALHRSSVVRSLVATLEQSNVIVHIESSAQMPLGIAGTTRFVVSRGGYRYVRITVHADLPPNTRTAILGHELQHACEIAESGVDSLEGMRQLYTLEGRRNGNYYETATAIETERRILTELSDGFASVTPK